MPQHKARLVDGTLAARIRTTETEGTYARIMRVFAQYQALRPQVNRLEERLTGLKNELKSYAAEHGEADDRGHKVVSFREPFTAGENTFTGFRNEARKSTYLAADAEQKLREHGIYERCTRTEVVLDQDEVYNAYQQGLISDELMGELFETRVTWAFKSDE